MYNFDIDSIAQEANFVRIIRHDRCEIYENKPESWEMEGERLSWKTVHDRIGAVLSHSGVHIYKHTSKFGTRDVTFTIVTRFGEKII